MKVLLVSHSFERNSRDVYTPNTAYSLGLGYLTAYLQKEGHTVDVLWMDGFPFDKAQSRILARIEDSRPGVLGIQMFTMNRVSSGRLIDECARRFPDMRIVVGGVHASALPEQIASRYKSAIVVIGEGELTFSELVAGFERGGLNLRTVEGIAFWDKDAVTLTAPRELIVDLDALPHPKHELFFEQEPLRTMAHVVTTRGCPFLCSFCCLHIITRRRHRKRNIEDVVREIVALKTKYPRLRTVQIHDDIFTLDNKRVIEFCDRIIALKLGVRFICSAKVKPVSEEMLARMKQAGFEKLMFGLETGSDRLLESIHKGIRQNDVVALFKKLEKFDFLVTTFLIVGFPGENADTVRETIAFVKQLQKISYSYIVGAGILWVYPGTEVYGIMKERGCITDDYWLTDGDVPFFTAEHDLATLQTYRDRMLDHLSITRVLTWKGFRSHFCQMPVMILRFLARHRNVTCSLIGNTIKDISPGLYLKIYRLLKKV